MTAVKIAYLVKVHFHGSPRLHVRLRGITANICMTAAALRCLLISPTIFKIPFYLYSLILCEDGNSRPSELQE